MTIILIKYTKLKQTYLLILLLIFINIKNSTSQPVETPVIDYVTVNQVTGKPIVSWLMNNPNLVSGYSIKRYIYNCSNPDYAPNSFHTIKVINDSFQLLYEDNSVDCPAEPNIRKETFGIIAFRIDAGDTVRSSIDAFHRTIFLQAEFDYCNKQNILKWNNYISWGSNFKNYEIYCKINSGTYTKIGTTAYNDTIFVHNGAEYEFDYKYYVKAVRNDGAESFSNITNVFTNTIKYPEYLKVDSLIVNDNISLYFNVDPNSEVKRYILYKSDNYMDLYDSVSGVYHTNKKYLNFTDNYNNEKNYYYLSAIDYCGDEVSKTEIISNIKIEVNKSEGVDKVNKIKWDYDTGNEFIIFRRENADSEFIEIDKTPELNYTDDIQTVFENQFINNTDDGTFCYYITTERNNFYNKSDIGCVEYEETVFIANAFNPNSNIEENRVFKPKIAFISDYELTVYNNFGNIIFQSNNPDSGWNGYLPGGKLAERASYLYFISYTNAYGKRIQKKGFVSLVY
ncbi:MAG: gliding motility-associated C-terminal domain-containing protein [Bacteroidales bacterium]|nr:gliding motility-associated C-terminal domain-containing protein [Bacteroidales bacterium]